MPEGHTIHRLARQHAKFFTGAPVSVSSPQGRFEDSVLVDGREFEGASAVGKHLFHHFGGGLFVHIHLGLYGGFTHTPLGELSGIPEAVGQVRMRIVGNGGGPAMLAEVRGPTVCEVLDQSARESIHRRLGPDPLDPGADPDRAFVRIARSTRPFGALLMDQKVLAGVGNVYRAEVLFRCGLSPFTPGRRVGREQFAAVWRDLSELMPVGVRTGGIVTIRSEHDHGDLPRRGADRPRNYVYQRDGWGCRVCSDNVQVTEMEGRTVFWCPTCQLE